MIKRIVVFSLTVILSLYLLLSASALELIPQMFTEDIEKYNAYIQENEDLPNNFVTYHALSALGAFRSFCTYDTPRSMQHYYYCIEVQADIDIFVYLDVNKKLDRNLETVDLSQIDRDMSYINEAKNCIIESEGFIYEYYDYGKENGKLASVSWIIGNLTFTIGCSDKEFNNLSPDSLLGRILSNSPKDHREAMNRIKINIISDWLRNSIANIIVVFFGLIISAAVFIVIGKRCRRQSAISVYD